VKKKRNRPERFYFCPLVACKPTRNTLQLSLSPNALFLSLSLANKQSLVSSTLPRETDRNADAMSILPVTLWGLDPLFHVPIQLMIFQVKALVPVPDYDGKCVKFKIACIRKRTQGGTDEIFTALLWLHCRSV
jgi:hypothetical protein